MNNNVSLTLKVVILCAGLLTSCATKAPEPVTITEVEYKPIVLDIGSSVDTLFGTRPPLSPSFTLDEEATATDQAILCALLYKQWGETWQDYAVRLEDYIRHLQELLLNPVPTLNPEPT